MRTIILPDKPEPGQSAATLWAFITVDKDGNESMCASSVDEQWFPMVTTKWATVELMRLMVTETLVPHLPKDCKIVLRAYTQATDREEFK